MISSFISLLLALFPILDIYGTGIPSISIGELALGIALILWCTTKKQTQLYFPIVYIIFIAYITLFPLLQAPYKDWFNLNNYLHNILGAFLYTFIIIVAFNAIDIKKTIQFIKYVVIFTSSFLILQECASLLFQIKIPGIIPGIPLSNQVDSDSFINHLQNTERFSSFFTEPAHFAQYASLGLILTLFSTEEKNIDMKIVLLITVALLLSRSGNAIVTSGLIWGIWILKNIFKKTNVFNSLKALLFLGISMLGIIYLLNTNETFMKLFNRVNEIGGTAEASVSGYIRIVRGYLLFYDFDWYNRFFGIGSGNIESYVESSSGLYYVQVTNILVSYLNGIQEVLISGGGIGLLLYCFFLRYVYVNNSKVGKVIIITLIALSLISSCYNNALWALYIVVSLRLSSSYLKERFFQKIINNESENSTKTTINTIVYIR